jgi:shikimate kinase
VIWKTFNYYWSFYVSFELLMEKNIVLVGFASSGKTAVGKVVAEEIGFNFIDLDDEIEIGHYKKNGTKVRCRDIYSTFGRDCFLELETEALVNIKNIKETVLATGGGAPIQENNRPLLKALGSIVYLYASPETLLQRMALKGLPVYLQDDPLKLNGLWCERHPVYKSIADYTIDTTEKDIQSIVMEVVHYYE